MAGPVDTRKRSREEEQNEFMPLSKRINNLHLNNNQNNFVGVQPEQLGTTMPHGQYPVGHQQHDYASHQNHHLFGSGAGAINGHSNHLGVTAGSTPSSNNGSNGSLSVPTNSASNSPASTQTSSISINGEILGDYCPVLTVEENPHYFTKNKVLYELYVERMRRLH